MAELLPCPFCGSTNIDCTNVGRNIDMWYVQCDNCYATFPQFDSKEESIEAWNTRTPKEKGADND
jgi:Lar family restriction alleviation protein